MWCGGGLRGTQPLVGCRLVALASTWAVLQLCQIERTALCLGSYNAAPASLFPIAARPQEALRMNPPLLLVMRYAKEAFKVTTSQGKTYTVPKVRSVLGWGAGARTTGGCS